MDPLLPLTHYLPQQTGARADRGTDTPSTPLQPSSTACRARWGRVGGGLALQGQMAEPPPWGVMTG